VVDLGPTRGAGADAKTSGQLGVAVYEEDDRDVNVLKTVLPLMSRHAAGYHPISYTVWYEYARDEKGALRQSVDEVLKRQERLTVPITYSLYTKFLVEPAERALLTARSGLMDLVEQVKQAVHQVDQDTSGFDERLNAFQRDVAAADSIDDLGSHVSSMLEETQRVSEGIGKINTQLDQSKDQVRHLTDELNRLREEAQTDALSGLLNRRGFDLELQRLALLAAKGNDVPALIMLDIDHFKKINDTYGHPLGDRVIAAVGRVIRESVAGAGVAARYGGEEFAVFLPRATSAVVEALANLIRTRIEQGKISRRQGEVPIGGVTISAGIAIWNRADDGASLIERADRALYASKQNGRNRVTIDLA